MNTTLTTAELFIELRMLCNETGASLDTRYFGDSEMHLVSISLGTSTERKRGDGFRFRQSGDSLQFCLWSILERTREHLNY